VAVGAGIHHSFRIARRSGMHGTILEFASIASVMPACRHRSACPNLDYFRIADHMPGVSSVAFHNQFPDISARRGRRKKRAGNSPALLVSVDVPSFLDLYDIGYGMDIFPVVIAAP
jgi:hypothetical protein